MNVLDWLMEGDPAIQRLTCQVVDGVNHIVYTEKGLVGMYLERFDERTGLWGGGVYGPKWISTHYTLLELKYMEVDPMHPYYQRGILTLLDHEWRKLDMPKHHENQDVCVLGMILGLCAYGRLHDVRLYEITDYLMRHQMSDGGWNCNWDSKRHPSEKSSLHTTLTVLEAFRDFMKYGYNYQTETLQRMSRQGAEFILSKRLYRSKSTGEIINPQFVQWHYPMRWKFDIYRALEYFASVDEPYDVRMDEALDLVVQKAKKGPIPKGPQYSGRFHFKLEDSKYGRFNTLRALKILKAYDLAAYEKMLNSVHAFS
ncbi:MAG TPA: hypothetical protein DCS67_08915 [Clostridiales bacterium UBA8960]|nr:hypothetical protein [Clostridiales bacterium UBA8960]